MDELGTQSNQTAVVVGHDMRRLDVPGGKKTVKGFALRGKGDVFGAGVGLVNLDCLPVSWVVEEVDREILGEGESEWGPQA